MDSLVAVAIHDAKNSLNALGVWLAQAREEFATQTGGAQSPALHQAEALADRLSSQLVELLALYRAGEGCLRLAIDDHRLDDFLADVMAELSASSPVAAHLVIETEFSAAATTDEWAFDAYLLKFVLLDALRNALRHARQRVRFSCALAPGVGLRLIVEDDGAGYPAALLREQADENSAGGAEHAATRMQESGSGLGLSFARLIAARHRAPSPQGERQGRLVNDGLEQGGARFSLCLP